VKKSSRHLSIIDRGFSIDGRITCDGQLVIKGSVKGIVNAESVVVSKEGELYAEIKAVDITIGGRFEGELSAAGDLIVMSSGTCSGTVSCKDLIVEPGGIVNATVTCRSAAGAAGASSPDADDLQPMADLSAP
jgi:cytoskeletal protein CcmA (bactofilin family)